MDIDKSGEEINFPEMTDKQRKIYESALEIFAQKGFSGASTGEIAKKAGVAEGLIFKHFKNKKTLFQKIAFAVVEKTLIPLTVQRIKSLLEKDYSDIRIFLTLFFEERLDFIKSNQSFLRIILQEISFDTQLQNFAREQFELKIFPLVNQFLKRHQEKGILKPLDTAVIIRLTMSSLLGYAVLRVLLFPDKNWDDKMEIQSTVDILCAGMAMGNQQLA
ncbi:MAG: TetR/AcrR family transcriptional regulator [Spirochaetia bacterium]|nr:TetR/AcrR family transcriptional regulator [Spirochaetia bacterium]